MKLRFIFILLLLFCNTALAITEARPYDMIYLGMSRTPLSKEQSTVLTNYLLSGVRLSDTATAGFLVNFDLSSKMQNVFEFRDVALMAYDKALLRSDHFRMYTDIRAFLPSSSISRKAGLITGIESFQITSFAIPKSRFAFGSYSSIRGNIFTPNSRENDFLVYFAPSVSYSFNPNFLAGMLVGLNISHQLGTPLADFKLNAFYLAPGAHLEGYTKDKG